MVVGYTSYGQRPPIEAPQPAAASSETSGPVDPVWSLQPVETSEAATAAVPVKRRQAIDTGRAGERKPPRPAACTEAVAALGLCATNGGAAAGAAIENLQTTDVGKTGAPEPSDSRKCTEATAALGLCAPAQGRE